jgi:hypothetical protein
VSTSVNLPVVGSYIDTPRVEVLIGNTLAEGWSEPARQNAGLAFGRRRTVNQGRPFSSIIGLWAFACAVQIASSPQ